MSRRLDRLQKIKKWQLNEVSRHLHTLNNEENRLHNIEQAMSAYLQREIKLYDQAVQTHAIVTQFLKNITQKQQLITQRYTQIEEERNNLKERLKAVYVEKKQLEILEEREVTQKIQEEAQQEQKEMDERMGRNSLPNREV